MGRNEKKRKSRFIIASFIMGVFLLIGGSVFLIIQGLGVSVASAEEAYRKTFIEETEKTAQEYYEWAFNKAEKNYHVSNEVLITIGEIEGQSKLEVLRVSDVEFIIQDDDDSEIIAWIAIPGDGVFTIDMTMSEFLIDEIRHIVTARVPQPRLTECRVESNNIDIYEFKTGKLINGNYAEGVKLAEEHLKEGYDMIKNEFISNQQYFLSAQQSAESLLTNLIRNLNSEIEDLKVEIEFVD